MSADQPFKITSYLHFNKLYFQSRFFMDISGSAVANTVLATSCQLTLFLSKVTSNNGWENTGLLANGSSST